MADFILPKFPLYIYQFHSSPRSAQAPAASPSPLPEVFQKLPSPLSHTQTPLPELDSPSRDLQALAWQVHGRTHRARALSYCRSAPVPPPTGHRTLGRTSLPGYREKTEAFRGRPAAQAPSRAQARLGRDAGHQGFPHSLLPDPPPGAAATGQLVDWISKVVYGRKIQIVFTASGPARPERAQTPSHNCSSATTIPGPGMAPRAPHSTDIPRHLGEAAAR